MTYNYFAATLPMLKFDGEPSMTMDRFKAKCRDNLSAGDFAALQSIFSGVESDNAFVRAWRARDTQLRNAVARIRASRLGFGDSAKWERPYDGFSVWVESGVTAAFQESDPAARERALDKLRWDLADELAGLDPFSAEAVFAYAIKLDICTRRFAIDVPTGVERLNGVAGCAVS